MNDKQSASGSPDDYYLFQYFIYLDFIILQLDRTGLGHNTCTDDAIALIVKAELTKRGCVD